MPFFQPVVHSDILLGCGSLRVQRPKTKKKMEKTKKSQGKRVYLFTSNGSMTMEAAIVMMLFLLAILSVTGYLMLINKQLACQIKVNNMAVAMAKMKFYKREVNKITDYQQELKALKKELIQSDEEVEENESGEIDVVSGFVYVIPWIHKTIQITQRCLVKDWTGCDITKSQEIVYITKNGKVYHITKECSHLSLSIRKIYYKQLSTERNCYGEKYGRCAICVKTKLVTESDIFVTEDGNKYHNSLMCSGLLRNIITVEKSKVQDKAPCSRCSRG